ncbi:PSD1 and planctomycete cytochrome C domain-containing protein [Pelagicoccus enzymogenes]|uniref:PSD1 and planctomycete cytochrome C domain-containing protein n=1 Tax=Pelagicoccus enzymogenes TaxID=2773457 RepID=UPI00280FE100|nr:PSD1 and planctomycete cytochrome C domain-containing protein [Pelagicoccus enzymogenes]MDQ8197054.1 PSD1 and planctomycete cytochrome C domain-containing protein [Pelagicoccus enzymogenes]
MLSCSDSRARTFRFWGYPLVVSALGFSIAFLSSCSSNEESLPFEGQVTFNEHVRPILTQNCTACHGGVKAAGGVSFIYRDTALGKAESGKQIIVPGSPNQSELMRRVTTEVLEDRMPPAGHGEALGLDDIAILEKWIREGAEWEEHWSYVAPVEQEIPLQQATDWAAGDIDRFVLAKLEEQGLSPNPEADKPELLRRVSLDLIGLPPSLEELDAFENDGSSDAYEKVVDRLLASPHFGERWATPWLDLARYADSKGYERDLHREIWGYRDWVVRSINEDMPFDTFTVAQIAGDLLPEPSLDDWVATGFHRNSKTNVEGGTDDEEFRIVSVMDRVSTTWQAWMGTTFSCVQCHSHPYDPFPHESYYEFMAYFNNTQDHDLKDEYPTIEYAIEEANRQRLFELGKKVEAVSEEYVGPFQNLSENVEWAPMSYASATGTQGVVFSIEREMQGREVLQLGPNAPKGTVHTVIAKSDLPLLEALRIDVPMQEGTSVEEPGDPFVLSFIEVSVIRAGGEKESVAFERVISDEANPRLWPELSLKEKGGEGWAAYPKQHYPRWAVFVPEAPMKLAKGDKLEVILRNDYGHDGAHMPVMRRFRFSLSDDVRWSELSRSSEIVSLTQQRGELLEELEGIERSSVPIQRERSSGYERITRVFDRGDWTVLGERVEPDVPALMKSGLGETPKDRLELARWIVSPQNPLTARVAVNRFWEQLFGRGIVETLEDFGSPGTPPSHPELLDYLALRFEGDLSWSRKALIREIVLSSTYRQSSSISEEGMQKDPLNVWLSRAPRKRLTAEMARDAALSVSGLLSEKMYGPPVMPLQPDGVWRTVYDQKTWETSEGEDRYRRAVYTYWKRSSPYPSFITFDAPSRDFCSPRRINTNTPLQALVSLNDPVYFECAEALAKQALALHEGSVAEGIEWACKRVLLADVSDADLQSLLALYEDSLESGNERQELAMTYVCSALLNLDEYLTR